MSDGRYVTTAAGFTFCRDCGALVMAGYGPEHDRMHPVLSCVQLGCGVYHMPDGTHPWESVYPRREDGRLEAMTEGK